MLALGALLALGGCDRGGRIDASGDSGTDAGPADASIPLDAEVPDADVDGGTPDPLAAALDDARGAATDAEAAQAALDPSVTSGLELVQLGLAQTRVDAIIGEKGTSLISSVDGIIGEKGATLALRTSAAAIAVLLRQLKQAADEIAAVQDVLPATPALAALRTALDAEIATLIALHTELLLRFDELVALDASLPGVEEPSYVDARSLHTMPEQSYVHAILEASATDTDGSVSVVCPGGTTAPLEVTVSDERGGGAPLVMGTGAGPHSFVLTADVPTLLRVDFTLMGVPHTQCDVEVRGRRHFRAAPIVLDSADADDLGTRRIDWDSRMSTLTGTIAMMRSEGAAEDIALATIVEDYLREASSESGRWRGGLTAIGPEDLDALVLTLEHVVIPLSEALEAYLATSPSRFATSVQSLLAALRAHNEAAHAMLAPAP